MTAVAVMIIVERGLIGLDDDLADILPELRKKEVLTSFHAESKTGQYVPLSEKITLRY
jgi:CubicO group peptidase (beta-lactamase class C family)